MATVRMRTRFTPWVEIDPTASTRAGQAKSGGPDSLAGRVLAPEVEVDSGFGPKVSAAPWGRSELPWWIWGAGVLVLGYVGVRAVRG